MAVREDAELRGAMLKIVRAYRKTDEYMQSFVKAGVDNQQLFEIAGEIADAAFCLTGEKLLPEDDFNTCTTYNALKAPGLHDDIRVRILMAEWRKNHAEQPKPRTMDREAFKASVMKNGGYMYERPEGDWK